MNRTVLGTKGTSIGCVLVTGATGFVGSVLVESAIKKGWRLRALFRRDRGAVPGVEWVSGDLLAPDGIAGVCEGVTLVIHAAGFAHAGDDGSAGFRELHWRTNFDACCRLYEQAAAAGVRRFVFLSSVKAGGNHPRRCLDEDSDLEPEDPYGRAKRAAEDWLFEQARVGGPEVVVVRPALVYGPGVKGNLAAMLRWIDKGLFPPVPETGNRRSMVDVRDLAAAVLAAAERPEAAGGVYIVSDGEDYSTRRIYEAMCRALGRRPRRGLPAGLLRGLGRVGDLAQRVSGGRFPYNSEVASRLLDSACYRSLRAERELGFRPRWCLEDALPEMVAAWRATQA